VSVVIVDASALLSMIFAEPAGEVVEELLQSAVALGIGAPTLTEVSLVLGNRLGRDPMPILGRLLQEFSIVVVPFSEQHWAEATDAFVRFGKGRHPAALNFGDCMTYAVAKLSDQALLAVGNDFPQTDLVLVPFG
jgi:ribonuclease VapC